MTVIHPRCEPCRINGRIYPSQKAAAAALGVCPSAISAAITQGRENRIGSSEGRMGNTNRAVPITLFGQEWPSRTAAAKELGVSRHIFSKLIHGRARDREQRLSAIVMQWAARHEAQARLDRLNAQSNQQKEA